MSKFHPVRPFCKLLLFLLIMIFGKLNEAQATPVVWTAPDLQRVGMTDASGSSTSIQLYAARGEYASFQVIVQGGSGGLSNGNLTVSNLVGPGSQVIPSSSFTLYAEHYLLITQNSPNWAGSNQPLPLGNGYFADALIPFNDPNTGQPLAGKGATYEAVPFSVNQGINQPFWVDLQIPRSAVAGTYQGTYTVSSNQGNFTGNISLTVWNFSLPVSPSMKSSFLFWTADSLEAEEQLLENGIEGMTATPANQSSLINNYGLNATEVGPYSGAYAGNCVASSTPSVSSLQSLAAQQNPALHLYDYSFDEITACTNLFPTVIQWAQALHQAGLNQLVTMAPNPALFNDGLGTGRSAVDDWVMLPEEYDGDVTYVNQALAKGDSAWSYNTLVQDAYSPKWELDFAPINYRIQSGFISATLGLNGLLYWRVDDWNSNPWNSADNAGTFSSNSYPGEALLVYPGTQVGVQGVVPSMRLKWIRDGVRDFEYVQLLKKAGYGSFALSLANQVGPDWTHWTRDINQIESVRIQLGQELNSLAGGTNPPPTPAPTPASPATVYQIVKAVGTDAKGASDITGMEVLVNSALNSVNGCWVYYNASTNQISLASNDTTTWTGPLTLGASGTLQNSQCTVYPQYSTMSRSGKNLNLNLAENFSLSFTATKNLYVETLPASGSTTGYQNEGAVSTAGASILVATGTYSSGYAGITILDLLVNQTVSGTNACWVSYNGATRQISLASNDTTTWTAPVTLGSAGILQNGQCSINAQASSAVGSGNNLTLSLSATFSASFAGTKSVYVDATYSNGSSSGYVSQGSFLAP